MGKLSHASMLSSTFHNTYFEDHGVGRLRAALQPERPTRRAMGRYFTEALQCPANIVPDDISVHTELGAPLDPRDRGTSTGDRSSRDTRGAQISIQESAHRMSGELAMAGPAGADERREGGPHELRTRNRLVAEEASTTDVHAARSSAETQTRVVGAPETRRCQSLKVSIASGWLRNGGDVSI